MTSPSGRLMCQYRRCHRFLPVNRGRGPRRRFCNATCRRRERELRDREQGRGYQRRGYPTSRPERRALEEGERFGSLTLLGYLTQPNPSGSSRAVFACDCGTSREATVNNVRRGVTTHCGDRAAHPRKKFADVD